MSDYILSCCSTADLTKEHFEKREAKRMDRFSHFAVVAAREAWKDSGLDKEKESKRVKKNAKVAKID